MRRKIAAALCTAAVASLSASTALAGEVTGTGEVTGARVHANSVCAYSGQNDDPGAALSLDLTIAPNGPGGVSQSFGQDVKLGLDPRAFNPGAACGPGTNPHRL
jgi:hypothetical protein